tara:strand:- start:373 stop:561 length:189 start_codon:yes stop_codon:yes gene_type:complete
MLALIARRCLRRFGAFRDFHKLLIVKEGNSFQTTVNAQIFKRSRNVLVYCTRGNAQFTGDLL